MILLKLLSDNLFGLAQIVNLAPSVNFPLSSTSHTSHEIAMQEYPHAVL